MTAAEIPVRPIRSERGAPGCTQLMGPRVRHRGGDVTHARQDPALALASLFRPLHRGRRSGGLTIEYMHGGRQVQFNLWRGLDSRDQSVLLGAVGLAGMLTAVDDTYRLPTTFVRPVGTRLWLDLNRCEDAARDHAVVLRTTRYALLQAAGLDNKGRNYGLLEDCLRRLSLVSCRVRGDDYSWTMQLLSYLETREGHLHIALNTRCARALSGPHVHVSLTERRELRREIAPLAHAWLSAWLREGSGGGIRLDTLAEKIWGRASRNASTTRSRRERLAKALDEIGKLAGWTVIRTGRGTSATAHIKRPSRPASLALAEQS